MDGRHFIGAVIELRQNSYPFGEITPPARRTGLSRVIGHFPLLATANWLSPSTLFPNKSYVIV
jgi:hypothetical protein